MKKIFLIIIFVTSAIFSNGQCGVTTIATNVTCNGNCDGSIIATASGQGPFNYLWAPSGQTSQSVSGLCAGIYTVTITDANNCTSNAVATITQPQVLSASVTTVNNVYCNNACNGSATVTASGGVPAYTYYWSSGQNTSTATGLCAGTYTVTVTDANLCTASVVVVITQPPLLIANISSVSNVSCNNLCDGTAMLIATGGTGPYIYSWSNNQTTSSISGLCAGTYTVWVTDSYGCTDSATATILPGHILYDSITSTGATCQTCCDGTANANPIGGTGPYTFSWSSGQNTFSVNGLCVGSYSVYLTDAAGCTNANTITITNGNSCSAGFYYYPDPQISSTLWVVNIASGAQPISYDWSWGDNSPDDFTPYPNHTYSSSGIYTICLTITDNLGCSSNYCNAVTVARYASTATNSILNVHVISPPTITFQGNPSSTLERWNIFPNPSNGISDITYSLAQTATVSLSIYDLTGNKITTLENPATHTAGVHLVKFDETFLEQGIYFLQINVNEKREVKRLIIIN